MALYYRTPGNIDKLLNVGEKDKIEEMNDVGEHVIEVQADGHELDTIKAQFSGIPMCKNRIVTWYGDDAKFIAKHFR